MIEQTKMWWCNNTEGFLERKTAVMGYLSIITLKKWVELEFTCDISKYIKEVLSLKNVNFQQITRVSLSSFL